MARRRLEVEIVGDASKLDKALGKASRDVRLFGSNVTSASSKVDAFFGAGAGKLFAAGGLALGLKSVVSAATQSQVVMGQTKVAVESVGISFDRESRRIDDAAQRISKAASMDDEAVLQSFQTFIRSQKDVGKAMDLVALSADVARGRYISLEAATQIVNKAAMGSGGALRRLGIDARAGASGVELLDLLHRKYGGAAQEYSESAAGSMDRLNKTFDDAKERLGNSLLPLVASLADGLADVIEAADKAATSLGKAFSFAGITNGTKVDGTDAMSVKQLQAMRDQVASVKGDDDLMVEALDKLIASRVQKAAEGAKQRKASSVAAVVGGVGGPGAGGPAMRTKTSSLENDRLMAQTTKTLKDDLATSKALTERAFAVLRGKREGSKAYDKALREYVAAQQDFVSVREAIASAIQSTAEKTKKATKKSDAERLAAAMEAAAAVSGMDAHLKPMKDAFASIRDITVEIAEAFAEQANDMKSEALRQLDRKQSALDSARALVDATEQLQRAKMNGGRFGIRAAQRDLEDAQIGRQRHLLESASVSANGRDGFNISGATFHFHGVQNVDQLLAQLQKLSKGSTGQTRGKLMSGGAYGIG